jgi:hypothetical protein
MRENNIRYAKIRLYKFETRLPQEKSVSQESARKDNGKKQILGAKPLSLPVLSLVDRWCALPSLACLSSSYQLKQMNPYPRKSKKSKEVAKEHSEEEEEDEDRVESEDEESEGGDDGDE